jgi:hypothetical protein
MLQSTLVTASADEVAVSSTAAEFANLKMVVGVQYAFCANTNAWICQGINNTTFTANDATSTFTAANHGLRTGQPVQVSESGGALPSGLSAATTYFAIYVDANDFQLATSRANAFAGTEVTISTNGSGTLTVATVATAGVGSLYVPAGVQVLLDGALGPALSVIQDSASGKASLAAARL